MKCGKDNVEMKSNGILVIHNKDVEEFECPKCHGVARVEVV